MDNLDFDRLAELAGGLNLSETAFQAILYGLSPQQRRLFLLLAEQGEADTMAVRSRCSIGNPSQVATDLSAKLTAAGDPRRVLCIERPHANRFGERGVIGFWRLVDTGKPAANDGQAAPSVPSASAAPAILATA